MIFVYRAKYNEYVSGITVRHVCTPVTCSYIKASPRSRSCSVAVSFIKRKKSQYPTNKSIMTSRLQK